MRERIGECQCGCGEKTTVRNGVPCRFLHGHGSRQAKLVGMYSEIGKRYKHNLIPGRARMAKWYRPKGPAKAGSTMKVKALVARLSKEVGL